MVRRKRCGSESDGFGVGSSPPKGPKRLGAPGPICTQLGGGPMAGVEREEGDQRDASVSPTSEITSTPMTDAMGTSHCAKGKEEKGVKGWEVREAVGE